MDSPWTIVGRTVDSAQVRKMFGDIGRTRLHSLRQQGVIPEPDARTSTYARPEWNTETIVQALPAGRRDWVVFEGFDAPAIEGQRWRFDGGPGELLEFPGAEGEPPVRAWRWRYENVSMWHDVSADHPAGELSLLVPLDGANWNLLAPYRSLAPGVAAACGYGEHAAGTILILDTATTMGLMGAEIPAGTNGRAQVESVSTETVARLLGHPVPRWPEGCATLELVAAWNPEDHKPVPVAELPTAKEYFALARRARSYAKTLRQTGADETLVKSFEDMDTEITNLWLNQFHTRSSSKPGVVAAISLPEPDYERYHRIGFIPALEWLTGDDGAPEDFARRATSYFGYVSSMGVAEALAPEKITPETAVRVGLVSTEEGASWVWKALREKAGSADAEAYRWAIEDAEFPTAVLATSTHWYFHTPRAPLPAWEDLEEMILSVNPTYGLGKDLQGVYHPLAIRPGGTAQAVAECLTAWARDGGYDVVMGQYSPLVHAPQQLVNMLYAQKAGQPTVYSSANVMAVAGQQTA